ncbi:hypothetical protein V6N13_123676 [Hibiscus sabdariffa]
MEPSRFDDTEPDEFQDSDYNGSSRTNYVTYSFDDSDFSVEHVSQYLIDVEMDSKCCFGIEPSATRRRVESEFESDFFFYSLDSVDESYSDSAYVVVDSENNSSWSWFLELLAEDLGLTNSYHVSFMTDKHKKVALWEAARATYMKEYEVALGEMNALPIYNNFNSFNKEFLQFILDARDKPIIPLLEIIQTKIMQRIAKKKVEADKWTTTLCPKIQQKLVASIERCWTTHAGHFKYQVACEPHTQHVVDLEKHTCSCRMWKLTGIPCNHVVGAILVTDRIPDEFVDQCYKTSTQQAICNHMV